ncbi:response regulator [Chryseosolibacter indicus]|uniref:Response regulator n=1 Tax=Chryseosolibacter indicus TaxID=2782351 RepID=A0ABS5VKF1_9BACT|nr:response regulator [Chryseosolibacter indicus]MBT1701856.1 response regulator [Chryseosolibacter indicus]
MDILFVDDDVEEREFFKDALSYVDSSKACVLTGDCEQALTLLKEAEKLPSYVFLDINMPMMDGKSCLDQIRRDPRLSNVKVVMYSTSSEQKLMEEYKKSGATYFMIKPSTFKGLCDSLSVLLDK